MRLLKEYKEIEKKKDLRTDSYLEVGKRSWVPQGGSQWHGKTIRNTEYLGSVSAKTGLRKNPPKVAQATISLGLSGSLAYHPWLLCTSQGSWNCLVINFWRPQISRFVVCMYLSPSGNGLSSPWRLSAAVQIYRCIRYGREREMDRNCQGVHTHGCTKFCTRLKYYGQSRSCFIFTTDVEYLT